MKRRDPDDKARPKPSAYDKALGLQARREHSRRELKQKLARGGYEEDEAGAALARLGEQHYQDDERFGGMLVRSRVAQGYGPLRIRAELKSHGLSDAAVRSLLDEAEADWDALAAAQLRRRYGGPVADQAERARRAQFLLRRGFTGSSVRAATSLEALDEDFDESE